MKADEKAEENRTFILFSYLTYRPGGLQRVSQYSQQDETFDKHCNRIWVEGPTRGLKKTAEEKHKVLTWHIE